MPEWAILGDNVPWTCRAASYRLIFNWNAATGINYCNDRLILTPNVEINCNGYFHATYFLEHVKCLKSFRNHTITRTNGGLSLVAEAEKNRSFTTIKSIAIEFVPAKRVELDVNTIIGDLMATRNSQSIGLSSSDDPTWVADWVRGVSRV